MRILLCTDGSAHAQGALCVGASLAQGSPLPATLLGVAERPEDRGEVERALEEGKELLHKAPEPRIKMREGHASEQILEEAATKEYDLVVVGTRGRQGITRFLLGSTAERITRHTEVPVLLVQEVCDSIERILVCTAGGKPGLAAAELAGRVARLVGAQVTVLHVMSQLPASPVLPRARALQVMPQTPAPSELSDDQIKDLDASAEQLMRGDTREGAHLREALAILADLGVEGEALVRHGLVIDKVLDETCNGDHDLVVVGSRPAGAWMRFLLNDISQQIIDCTDRPVLVARTPSEQGAESTTDQDIGSSTGEEKT